MWKIWITSFGKSELQTVNFMRAETTCLPCFLFYLFIYSTNMSVYLVLDNVLGNRDTPVNKINKNPCPL